MTKDHKQLVFRQKRHTKMALLMLTLCLAFGGVLSKSTPAPTPAPADFVTVLKGLGNYSSILGLIDAAGLTDTLLQVPKLTLLLPTDEAIQKLSPDTLQSLQDNPQELLSVLGYHVIVGNGIKINSRKDDRTYTSYNNQTIRFNQYKILHKSAFEGVEVVEKNIPVANGYVHGLNGVMVPPTGDIVDLVTSRPDLTTLASLLSKAGLIDVIKADQNMTVFAPNDAAFAKVNPAVLDYLANHPDDLMEVLRFHLVKRQTLYSVGMRHSMTFPSANKHHDKLVLIEDFSGNAFVDNAKILEKDISTTDGVMHVIDGVLLPTRTILEMEKAGVNIG